MTRITKLPSTETKAIVRDARIVAIRWDLIEWSLVLDLDIPVSEAPETFRRRAWAIFDGISDVSLELHHQRLPRGIEVVDDAMETQNGDGFNTYTMSFISMDRNEKVEWFEFEIRARGVFGLVSEGTYPSESTYSIRTQNASDEDFLGVLRSNPKT